uniref:hypothetical protein n=1 Tax=Thaumasiovibrio occultus TaxID=1891184 RepID=UPI000B35237E|nr:hypothetical protein [Thaumasiovibrio occultus]
MEFIGNPSWDPVKSGSLLCDELTALFEQHQEALAQALANDLPPEHVGKRYQTSDFTIEDVTYIDMHTYLLRYSYAWQTWGGENSGRTQHEMHFGILDGGVVKLFFLE